MRKCPYCAEEIQDNARFCRRCQRDLTGALPPAAVAVQSPPEMNGKAVASLALSVFPVIPILGTVVGIVLGHIARAEIRRSAGRLKGDGLALAGLIAGYVFGGLSIILIAAAIAIPNLLQAKIAANQASAVASLRTIDTCEVEYASTYRQGYSRTLAALGMSSGQPANADAAGLLENLLAGRKSGYTFTYRAEGTDASGKITGFSLRADPVKEGTTGRSHYYADETNVIRQEAGGRASKDSPPIGL